MNMGQRIKERRLALGLTVDDVAVKLKKNRATIYRYENDEIENFPISILWPLAEILKCTPAYIMGWEEGREFPPVVEGELRDFIKRNKSKAQPNPYSEENLLAGLDETDQKTILNLIESLKNRNKK